MSLGEGGIVTWDLSRSDYLKSDILRNILQTGFVPRGSGFLTVRPRIDRDSVVINCFNGSEADQHLKKITQRSSVKLGVEAWAATMGQAFAEIMPKVAELAAKKVGECDHVTKQALIFGTAFAEVSPGGGLELVDTSLGSDELAALQAVRDEHKIVTTFDLSNRPDETVTHCITKEPESAARAGAIAAMDKVHEHLGAIDGLLGDYQVQNALKESQAAQKNAPMLHRINELMDLVIAIRKDLARPYRMHHLPDAGNMVGGQSSS